MGGLTFEQRQRLKQEVSNRMLARAHLKTDSRGRLILDRGRPGGLVGTPHERQEEKRRGERKKSWRHRGFELISNGHGVRCLTCGKESGFGSRPGKRHREGCPKNGQ